MTTPVELPPISETILSALADRRDAIIRETVQRILTERPEEVAHWDKRATDILGAGMLYTMRACEAAMSLHEPALLRQQLVWSYERLPHDGVSPTLLLRNLWTLQAVIAALLSPDDAQMVLPWIDYMVTVQQEIMHAPE